MAFSITDLIIIIILFIFTLFGAIKGILAKAFGFINVALAGLIAYYVAAPISTLFVSTSFYENIQNTLKNWTPVVFLTIIFLILFVILLIIFKLISKILVKAIAKGTLLNAINHILGGVYGLVIGLFISMLYLLIFYGLAQVSTNINAFYVSDLCVNNDQFTISKFLMDYTMRLFNNG